MTTKVLEGSSDRVNRAEFLRRVAVRSGVSVSVVTVVYGAIVDEILDIVSSKREVILSGFGKFYGHKHKGGQPAQFTSGGHVIRDYSVLKFSAIRAINQRIDDDKGNMIV